MGAMALELALGALALEKLSNVLAGLTSCRQDIGSHDIIWSILNRGFSEKFTSL